MLGLLGLLGLLGPQPQLELWACSLGALETLAESLELSLLAFVPGSLAAEGESGVAGAGVPGAAAL